MALNGKKINQLEEITSVTDETVIPAVRVQNETPDSTAVKIPLQKIKQFIKSSVEEDVYTKTQVDNLVKQPITILNVSSGTISLESNTVYSAILTGNTTFSLPFDIDTTQLNQILIQLKIVGSITIGWGTEKYFTETPSSTEGKYNIIYEYDVESSNWYVGQIQKV